MTTKAMQIPLNLPKPGRPARIPLPVPSYSESLIGMTTFRDNLIFLLDSGIRPTDIAASFGVTYWTVWAWRNGEIQTPKGPILNGVNKWAEKLRQDLQSRRSSQGLALSGASS